MEGTRLMLNFHSFGDLRGKNGGNYKIIAISNYLHFETRTKSIIYITYGESSPVKNICTYMAFILIILHV